MKKTKREFACDICSNRFRISESETREPDHEILCPRCRTPFVRPVGRKAGSWRNGTSDSADVPRCMAFS